MKLTSLKTNSLWILLAAAVVIPFGYYFIRAVTPNLRAHAGSIPPMVPSTLVFSEVVSVGKPAQHAIRVIAHRADYSVSDTYFYTHTAEEQAASSMDEFSSTFDRQMHLVRPDGYFTIEVYTRSNSKSTFPAVPEFSRRIPGHAMNPDEDCQRTYSGKPALGKEIFVGKQKILLPGLGLTDAIMTHLEQPDIDLTAWYAPSLGCAEVQHIAVFPSQNGSVAMNAMYPVSAKLGEPSSELFSDAGTIERQPAQIALLNTRSSLSNRLPEPEIQDKEAKISSSAALKGKQKQYLQAWDLFRAGKLKP